MFEIVHNVETGEVVERVFTTDELKIRELAAEEAHKKELLINAEQVAKAEQRAALLAKLGITEEEAKLLLGGN